MDFSAIAFCGIAFACIFIQCEKESVYTFQFGASGILLQSIGIQVLDCCTDPFLLVSFAAFYENIKKNVFTFFILVELPMSCISSDQMYRVKLQTAHILI